MPVFIIPMLLTMKTEHLLCCHASLALSDRLHKFIITLKTKREVQTMMGILQFSTQAAEMQSKHKVIYAAVTFEACFLFTVVLHAASCPAIYMLLPQKNGTNTVIILCSSVPYRHGAK